MWVILSMNAPHFRLSRFDDPWAYSGAFQPIAHSLSPAFWAVVQKAPPVSPPPSTVSLSTRGALALGMDSPMSWSGPNRFWSSGIHPVRICRWTVRWLLKKPTGHCCFGRSGTGSVVRSRLGSSRHFFVRTAARLGTHAVHHRPFTPQMQMAVATVLQRQLVHASDRSRTLLRHRSIPAYRLRLAVGPGARFAFLQRLENLRPGLCHPTGAASPCRTMNGFRFTDLLRSPVRDGKPQIAMARISVKGETSPFAWRRIWRNRRSSVSGRYVSDFLDRAI